MLVIANSDDRSGLVLVLFRLAATSAEVTGWPLENSRSGSDVKRHRGAVVRDGPTLGDAAADGAVPGAVIDW